MGMFDLVEIKKNQWIIYKANGDLVVGKTFKECMEYFEGLRIPRKCLGDRLEPFQVSMDRVTKYIKRI